MSATLDTSVLVSASNSSDPAEPQASALLERIVAGPDITYIFWPVIMGYLRIVTHPAILPRPASPGDALRNIEGLVSLPHIRSPSEDPGFWPLFSEIAADARGNDVPDAHIVALMRSHGVRVIYTRDRDFRRYDEIEPRWPE